MDLRIVNTCTNNCMYCLEQSLREKEKFVDKYAIFKLLGSEKNKEVLSFYGGNPLMHPDLSEIISYAKKIGFNSISLLTNTSLLNESYLNDLLNTGLNSISTYFNSFDESKHNKIVNGGIALDDLIGNIKILSTRRKLSKLIIHINKQNVEAVYKDILILNKKYGVNSFDFINYFPFDRPYNKFKDILEYDILENRKNIDNLFKVIIKLNLSVNFLKFKKDFFGSYQEFYDFENGIKNQIGDEDIERLDTDSEPFCYEEKRCKSCFISDDCKFYAI